MKAYKGFNKDMTCRGFKFEQGKTYETDEAKLCESGFHACEMPLDCFNYYAPSDSVFHEVELDATDEKGNDSKRVGKKIKIGARLSISKIVDAQIEYIKSQTHEVKGGRTAGLHGAASATGDRGAASATGKLGVASATGKLGVASATGDLGAASATGEQGAASATGDQGAASATGKGSIAMASGYGGKAKACIGNAICLCERGKWNGETYPLLNVKAAIIDGKALKPDTWYTLKNGEFVEVKE